MENYEDFNHSDIVPFHHMDQGARSCQGVCAKDCLVSFECGAVAEMASGMMGPGKNKHSIMMSLHDHQILGRSMVRAISSSKVAHCIP